VAGRWHMSISISPRASGYRVTFTRAASMKVLLLPILMPYAYSYELPEKYQHRFGWCCPNPYFDPVKGPELYTAISMS